MLSVLPELRLKGGRPGWWCAYFDTSWKSRLQSLTTGNERVTNIQSPSTDLIIANPQSHSGWD